jgi:hypothetical protein
MYHSMQARFLNERVRLKSTDRAPALTQGTSVLVGRFAMLAKRRILRTKSGLPISFCAGYMPACVHLLMSGTPNRQRRKASLERRYHRLAYFAR